ncbi:MAG: O-antigen ligase family protein [Candidatus Eremiobacteraeota bacterium]|nr:O-antigen ligase family protein [Candidatus Eremiobacteraeota bacterium]
MTTLLRTSHQRGLVVAAAYFATGALAAAMFVGAPHLPLSGSPLGLLLAIAIAVAPVALALAVTRPLILPFAFWAALVPFDNLLVIGGIGRIGKPLGAAAAFVAILTMLIRRRALLPPASVGVWALLAFFATVSFWWARNPDFGVLMLQQIVSLMIVGAILSMLPADRRDLTALFFGVVGGGVAASVYAIVLYAATGHPAFIGDSSQPIDHNHFGAALLLPGLCATVAAIALRSTTARAAAALAAALCVAGIGVSESRGALIAFGVGVVYLMVRSAHRRRLFPFAVVASVVLAFIPGVFARFGDATAGDAAGRYQLWHIGFAAFKHHWFAGHGFGMFMTAYQQAFLEFSQPAAGAQRIQMPHNILVEFAVELGIVGVALILFAWWTQFRTLREIGPHEGGWFDARLAVEAATLSMFVSALSLDLLTFKYTWLAISAAWILRAGYRSTAPQRAANGVPAVPDRA